MSTPTGTPRHRPPARRLRAAAALLAIVLTVTACGAEPPDAGPPPGVVTLRIGDSYPPSHPASRDGVDFFVKRAVALSGGRLDFDYFPSAQLGEAEDHVALTRSGAIDIGVVSPPYLADRLPLSNVADLPGMSTDACRSATALTSLMSPGGPDGSGAGILHTAEYGPQGLRMLFVGVQPGYEVMTVGTPVTAPSDVAGLQLRSSGGVLDMAAQALGAAPVSISGPEMYEALSRGTVDGTMLPPMSATPYRLDEVTTDATLGAPLGSFTLSYAVGEGTWERLPEDLRAALTRAGAETTAHLCAAIEQENERSRTSLAEGGLHFTQLSGEQIAQWRAALDPVRGQWVADMEERGLPGAATLTAMEQALATGRGGSDG